MGKLLKACFVLFLLFIFVCGTAFIVISYLPSDQIKVFFDSFTNDGNFSSFSFAYVLKLRIIGALICVLTGLVYITRKILSQNISNLFGLIFYFIKEIKETVKKEDKVHIYTLLLIILIAIAVRIAYLFQPLMADETGVFTTYVYDVANGVQGILSPIARYNHTGNHIFHTFLVYFTYKFLGSEQNIWIIRLPALFAGILLVPASYMVTRIFHNKNSALLAAGIVASSSPLVFYSTNARGYTMLCLFFLLILAVGAYIKNNTDLAGWHLFAILSAFGFYTIPTMLYPYGILITWLILSMFFKDTNCNSIYLLRNLLVSMVITILLTSILYSPVVFFGPGFETMLNLGSGHFGVPLKNIPKLFSDILLSVWVSWNASVPDIITYLFMAGFIVSMVFHKQTSNHRVPLILSVIIGLITITLFHGETCSYSRCWIFLLPLYIGLVSSGIVHLFKPIDPVVTKYKTTLFAVLAVTISLIMAVNTVRSELAIDDIQVPRIDNIDRSGKHIEFRYIQVSIMEHIGRTSANILVLFAAQPKNDFWNARFQYYFDRSAYLKEQEYLITDLNSFPSDDSKKCNKLFLLSDVPIPGIKVLLEENGVPASDFSLPKLIHRYKYANLYQMNRATTCKKSIMSNTDDS